MPLNNISDSSFHSSPAADIDLEPIMVKLCHTTRGHGWDMERAEAGIALYRRWLWLHLAFPEMNFSPSDEIDKVWHAHQLDNEKYARDCQEMFGRMLYHNPYAGMLGPDDEAAQAARFAETKRLFAHHFPDMIAQFGEEALCDSGYCDDIFQGDRIERPTLKHLQLN
jgi:hypothetical protein